MSAIAETTRPISSPPAPALIAGKGITRIALVGPDGVGKSTVIRLLRESLCQELPWLSVQVRQWRPGLLPNLRELASKPQSGEPGQAQRPRRTPGRFHLLRIAYYLLDYLAGSWWKDRVRAAKASLIIYDRCALDMQVDPVRFALSSKLGTHALWRLTPKPDLVILLEDDPHRILQRKQELEAHEMVEQQAEWHRLAERGIVHAAIRVDAGAHEIAEQVRQLTLEVLAVRHAARTDAAHGDSLLWFRNAALEPGSGAERPFMPVPSLANARLLVPPAPNLVAAQALAIYSPQRSRSRLARTLLRAGMRSGIAQVILGDRVSLPTREIERHLRLVTGAGDVVVSVSLGTPGPNRKPAFQAMSLNGEVLAYAKIGCSERSNELVRNEAASLRALSGYAFSTAIVPRLLDHRSFGGRPLVVQAAERSAGASPRHIDHRHLRFLVELTGVDCPSRISPVHHRLADSAVELRNAGFAWYAGLLDQAADFAASALADVPTVFTHGDFAPWNTRESAGRLLVYDWEYAGPGLPASDLLHFLVSTAVELQRHDGARVFRMLMSAETQSMTARYLAAVGCDEGLVLPLLIAWAAESLTQNALLHGHGVTGTNLAARRVLASLLFLALNRAGDRS